MIKRIALAAGLPAACLALSACETYGADYGGYGYGGYGYGGGYSQGYGSQGYGAPGYGPSYSVGVTYHDAFYDDFYGPIHSGYWDLDGFFYYQLRSNSGYVRDHGRHFRREAYHGARPHRFNDYRGGGRNDGDWNRDRDRDHRDGRIGQNRGRPEYRDDDGRRGDTRGRRPPQGGAFQGGGVRGDRPDVRAPGWIGERPNLPPPSVPPQLGQSPGFSRGDANVDRAREGRQRDLARDARSPGERGVGRPDGGQRPEGQRDEGQRRDGRRFDREGRGDTRPFVGAQVPAAAPPAAPVNVSPPSDPGFRERPQRQERQERQERQPRADTNDGELAGAPRGENRRGRQDRGRRGDD